MCWEEPDHGLRAVVRGVSLGFFQTWGTSPCEVVSGRVPGFGPRPL